MQVLGVEVTQEAAVAMTLSGRLATEERVPLHPLLSGLKETHHARYIPTLKQCDPCKHVETCVILRCLPRPTFNCVARLI